jgi:hypothetical protein
MSDDALPLVDRFIRRWSNLEGGQERANYSLFLTEFCDVLGVVHPDPAGASHEFNDYVFERRVKRHLADGTSEIGRIDLYKRGHFILEAKQSRQRGGKRVASSIQADLFTSEEPEPNPFASTLDHLMIQARLRPALNGLPRYIATVETAKHRLFQFVNGHVLPDNMLVAIASDSPFHLGILSSSPHVTWALRSGGRQGVGNDPRYSKTRCFDPFPFPDATTTAKARIGTLAQELDQTRKAVLAENPDLTLTTLYNVLAAVREGNALSAKERDIQTRGRVLIIKELHDQLDGQVFSAYGWQAGLSDAEILKRLVELNQARAADERREQAGCVLDLLGESQVPLTSDQLAARFKEGSRIKPQIQEVLTSLDRLGQIESHDEGRSFIRAAS